MKRFRVVGSINMDLVVGVDRFPLPGETVTGTGFRTVPGGKGANQAVALARLGAGVDMVGRVGRDSFGDRCLEILASEGVGSEGIGRDPEAPTGTALIEVDAAGENRIVVVPGANRGVTPEYLEERLDGLPEADILLLQLEIPLESVLAALRGSRAVRILDPAPARKLPDTALALVDYLTPNENELEALSGLPVRDPDEVGKAARLLVGRGAGTVIVKAGRKGAYIVTGEKFLHIPGFEVAAADTTGAGDTFNGAFAFALGGGLPAVEAVRFANAAAALSTTRPGAQTAMPGKAEVLELLGR